MPHRRNPKIELEQSTAIAFAMNSILRTVLDGQLGDWLAAHGQPAFRRRQIERWIAGGADDFEAMSDLPKSLREALRAEFVLRRSHVARHQRDPDGTEKLLLEWSDGQRIEGVLLRDARRRTVCISTQVGCAMGCVFCASGLSGLERDLRREEILEQVLRLQACLGDDERLSHVVVMGMGEPLANLDELLPALDFLASADGLGISARRITLSTVGLPAAIRRLARHARPYRLAISLHAADDTLRSQLIPVNRSIGIAAVLEAADDYFRASGRRITFEYTLLGGINDRAFDASRLATLLRGRTALINLIPYNPVPGLPYPTPRPSDVRRFRDILEEAGIDARIRKRRGAAIEAACGQLRRVEAEETLSSSGGVE